MCAIVALSLTMCQSGMAQNDVMADDYAFTNNAEQSRYELRLGGDLVSVLEYRINADVVALTRAFTNPAKRGHGYAAVVTERAIDAIEADGRKALPVCWYVADWFADHPERANVLASA